MISTAALDDPVMRRGLICEIVVSRWRVCVHVCVGGESRNGTKRDYGLGGGWGLHGVAWTTLLTILGFDLAASQGRDDMQDVHLEEHLSTRIGSFTGRCRRFGTMVNHAEPLYAGVCRTSIG